VEIEHFVGCIATGERPETDVRHGRDVVAILEAADRSAASGRSFDLTWAGAAAARGARAP
jgi:predicted dehydrogenase